MLTFLQRPWIKAVKDVDADNMQDALRATGLDYEVGLVPVRTEDGRPIPDTYATVRKDTGAALGVVGKRYKVTQARDSFDIMNHVLGLGAKLESVGEFDGGRRIFAVARTPENLRVGNTDDQVAPYMIAFDSRDGSSGLQVRFTPTRVVCWNQISGEIRKGSHIKIRHVGDMARKLDIARDMLNVGRAYFDEMTDAFGRMASVKLSESQVRAYFRGIYGHPEREEEATVTRNVLDRVMGLWEGGIGHDDPSIKHSVWTAYNAVTEYEDHHRKSKDRVASSWFGHGYDTKRQAFDAALALA